MSTGPSSIRIMTVDDHPLLCQGIAAIIKTQPDLELVAEASDGEEAIKQCRKEMDTFPDRRNPSVNCQNLPTGVP